MRGCRRQRERSERKPGNYARRYLIQGHYYVMIGKVEGLNVPFSDVKTTGRIKYYPDGTYEFMVANKPIFGGSGFEERGQEKGKCVRGKRTKETNLARSRRRAISKFRDYAMCSDFKFFVTLTFAPDKVDRYDLGAIIKTIRSWLDNRVRRKGLVYLLVPELHKDGAVHMHGLFNDCPIGIVDSGTIDHDDFSKPRKPRGKAERERWLTSGGRIVYNISDWGYGFSTAIELYGERVKAVSYAVKYITKMDDKIGGRWYYGGGALRLPLVVLSDCNLADVLEAYPDTYTIDVPEAGLCFGIRRACKKQDFSWERKTEE